MSAFGLKVLLRVLLPYTFGLLFSYIGFRNIFRANRKTFGDFFNMWLDSCYRGNNSLGFYCRCKYVLVIYKDIFIMDLKRKILLIICLIVIVAIVIVWNKPSISQYEDSFGFSLENTKVKVIDFYHHDDFRDSLTLYRVVVSGETDGSVFDLNKMSDGLSLLAESMLKMAVDSTSENDDFTDLAPIDKDNCKSTVLRSVNGSDANLCVINNGIKDQFIVIWVG